MKEEPKDLWLYENEAFSEGFETVCGVDEAGRGPLAGPVCAAAVILPKGLVIDGLNDSKKLTDKKRRELYDVITQSAVSYGIAMASEQEIDEINILQATFLAMQRALDKLAVKPDLALIDGNRAKDFGLPVRTIVKGDSLSSSIAAASILAKVTRDRLMEQLDAQYPQYGFAVHKGYGTRRHYAALREYGPCEIHRRGARRWRQRFFASGAIILSRPTTAAATARSISLPKTRSISSLPRSSCAGRRISARRASL